MRAVRGKKAAIKKLAASRVDRRARGPGRVAIRELVIGHLRTLRNARHH